jgi:hypothetical protein
MVIFFIYPSFYNPTKKFATGSFLVGMIGVLLSLFGIWVATSRHPFAQILRKKEKTKQTLTSPSFTETVIVVSVFIFFIIKFNEQFMQKMLSEKGEFDRESQVYDDFNDSYGD